MDNTHTLTPETQDFLVEQFRTEVHLHAEAIDPDNEHDWLSLTLGWAIAKGLTPEQAQHFSLHIRYSTDLG